MCWLTRNARPRRFTSPASQQLTGEECYAGCSLVLSTSQLSTVGAVINVGAMAGAALGAVVADQGGRTRTLVLACLPFLVGSLCTAAASSFAALVLGRALSGVGAGLVSLTAPVYLAEIAPTRSDTPPAATWGMEASKFWG